MSVSSGFRGHVVKNSYGKYDPEIGIAPLRVAVEPGELLNGMPPRRFDHKPRLCTQPGDSGAHVQFLALHQTGFHES